MERDARAFTADGWYRTGDVVHWRASGNPVATGPEPELRENTKLVAELGSFGE